MRVASRLLSRRVANDEPELLELLTDVLALWRRGDLVASTWPTAEPPWP
ncbi:hypothetical protein [Streptomyces hydrogenans]|nr:hypothetical protein [Streptomyces hydrogenans]